MSSPILKTKLQIRFRDLDTLAHVNNAVYLTYFELGRLLFFRKYVKGFNSNKLKFVIARAEIDFKMPITLDDEIFLETSISSVGNTSFTFSHRIIDERGPTVFCEGRIIAVSVDDEKRPVSVPQEIKDLAG